MLIHCRSAPAQCSTYTLLLIDPAYAWCGTEYVLKIVRKQSRVVFTLDVSALWRRKVAIMAIILVQDDPLDPTSVTEVVVADAPTWEEQVAQLYADLQRMTEEHLDSTDYRNEWASAHYVGLLDDCPF